MNLSSWRHFQWPRLLLKRTCHLISKSSSYIFLNWVTRSNAPQQQHGLETLLSLSLVPLQIQPHWNHMCLSSFSKFLTEMLKSRLVQSSWNQSSIHRSPTISLTALELCLFEKMEKERSGEIENWSLKLQTIPFAEEVVPGLCREDLSWVACRKPRGIFKELDKLFSSNLHFQPWVWTYCHWVDLGRGLSFWY